MIDMKEIDEKKSLKGWFWCLTVLLVTLITLYTTYYHSISHHIISKPIYHLSSTHLRQLQSTNTHLSHHRNVQNTSISSTNSLLGYCTHNSYLAGKWIYNVNKTDKDFHCCQRADMDFLHNDKICGEHYYEEIMHPSDAINPFMWSPVNFTTTPMTVESPIDGSWIGQYPLLSGSACYCDSKYHTRYSPAIHEQYDWQPLYCTLPIFNGNLMTSYLQHERILFIGDHSMQQFYETLQNLMIASNNSQILISWQYYGADYLSFDTHKRLSFINAMHLFKPTMVFMSVGSALGDLGDIESVWTTVIKQIETLQREISPLLQFIWIQQLLGQSHCDAKINQTPLPRYNHGQDRQEMEVYEIKYEFEHYIRKQIQLKREESLVLQSTLHYIDLAPLWLRPDSKTIDCIYFCLPGPLSLVWRIVLSKLLTKEIIPSFIANTTANSSANSSATNSGIGRTRL